MEGCVSQETRSCRCCCVLCTGCRVSLSDTAWLVRTTEICQQRFRQDAAVFGGRFFSWVIKDSLLLLYQQRSQSWLASFCRTRRDPEVVANQDDGLVTLQKLETVLEPRADFCALASSVGLKVAESRSSCRFNPARTRAGGAGDSGTAAPRLKCRSVTTVPLPRAP